MSLTAGLLGTVPILNQSTDDAGPGDTMQERASDHRLKRWLLLDANRWIIVGILMTVLFGTLVALTAVSPIPIIILQTESSVNFVFSSLITGTITGVSLVLTINQLVVSQELGPLGKQRNRMEGAMDFRQDVEDIAGLTVSPTEPSTFFRALVEASQRQASTVQNAIGDDIDGEVREDLEEYLNNITENASDVSDQLKGAQFGTFQVLSSALDYDYSRKIHSGRQIQSEYRTSLSDAVLDSLDDLLEILKFLGPAREHFKTFYFQWELINLSYAILYAAIPALIAAFTMTLFFDPAFVSGTVLGINTVLLVVCAGVTIGVVPFIVLLAYILRIATVAKRTLAVGPFTLRAAGGSEDIHWEDE
jgi:hypothetical protein